jgi:hypothetical protein
MGMSHSIMEQMIRVDSVMKPLVPIISKIPYVGVVFQAMFRVYDNLVVYVVKPIDNVVKKVNDFSGLVRYERNKNKPECWDMSSITTQSRPY